MSTTYRAILMLGCKGEFKKITRLEERFDPKTGQPTKPEQVFDRFDLVVENDVVWSGKEEWEADEFLDVRHGIRVWRNDYDSTVIVGEQLKSVECPGNYAEILPSTDAEKVGKIHAVLGTVPTLFLIQDCF